MMFGIVSCPPFLFCLQLVWMFWYCFDPTLSLAALPPRFAHVFDQLTCCSMLTLESSLSRKLTLTTRRLNTQTGIDIVCGPEGEFRACYQNGYELPCGEETTACDGDFFACWLETEPQVSTCVATGGNTVFSASCWASTVEYTRCSPTAAGVGYRQ